MRLKRAVQGKVQSPYAVDPECRRQPGWGVGEHGGRRSGGRLPRLVMSGRGGVAGASRNEQAGQGQGQAGVPA